MTACFTLPNKLCQYCKKEKPVTEFNRNKSTKDGLYSYCKECTAMKNKEWNLKNMGKPTGYSWKRAGFKMGKGK